MAAAAVAAAALAGCGGGSEPSARVDNAALERSLLTLLQRQTATVVDRVACPNDIEPQAGRVFECNAAFNGEADAIVVTLINASAARPRYRARLKNLLLGKLESAIVAQFRRAGTRLLAVDCPGPQPQRRGGAFRCAVQDARGRRGRVSVTQTDDRGTVRFRLL